MIHKQRREAIHSVQKGMEVTQNSDETVGTQPTLKKLK